MLLLQSLTDSGGNLNVGLLVAIAIAVFLMILITRAIFSIPQMLRYFNAQTELLVLIAADGDGNSPLVKNKINKIIKENNLEDKLGLFQSAEAGQVEKPAAPADDQWQKVTID